MSEFHDPELRQQLGRVSGQYPDDNAAFAAWQRRVGQARRRRAVAFISATAMSLIVATIGVAALQNSGQHTLVPGNSLESTTDLSITTTEADDSTTETTASETVAPIALAADTTASIEAASEMPEPEPEATVAAGSGSNAGKGSSGSATPPPAPASDATKTFHSVGGSITVRQDGDRLTVISIDPAPGFEDEQKEGGDGDHSSRRVIVSFKSENHRSEISVRVSDGVMTEKVSEQSESHEESFPGDSHDGGHGGDEPSD